MSFVSFIFFVCVHWDNHAVLSYIILIWYISWLPQCQIILPFWDKSLKVIPCLLEKDWILSPLWHLRRGKDDGCSHYYSTLYQWLYSEQLGKKHKDMQTGKEDKTSLFGGNIILDADYLNQAKKKVLIKLRKFWEIVEYKPCIKIKCILYTSNKQVKN